VKPLTALKHNVIAVGFEITFAFIFGFVATKRSVRVARYVLLYTQ
jgi:hypothetical protein